MIGCIVSSPRKAKLIQYRRAGPRYESGPCSCSVTGLQNVRERLALMCGGTLEISAIAGGTAVVIRIPPETRVD